MSPLHCSWQVSFSFYLSSRWLSLWWLLAAQRLGSSRFLGPFGPSVSVKWDKIMRPSSGRTKWPSTTRFTDVTALSTRNNWDYRKGLWGKQIHSLIIPKVLCRGSTRRPLKWPILIRPVAEKWQQNRPVVESYLPDKTIRMKGTVLVVTIRINKATIELKHDPLSLLPPLRLHRRPPANTTTTNQLSKNTLRR